MIRNAQKEQAQSKPPRDFRKIYQFVRDAMDARRMAPTNDFGAIAPHQDDAGSATSDQDGKA